MPDADVAAAWARRWFSDSNYATARLSWVFANGHGSAIESLELRANRG